MTTKKLTKQKTSKRITTHARVNTQKRIKEAKRKIKKEYRKMKKQGVAPKKKKTKELKVPNMHPLKKQMLEQMKRSRNGQEKAKELEEQDQGVNREEMIDSAVVQLDTEGMVIEDPSNAEGQTLLAKRSSNNMKSIQYIFENADVLLEVLDARDPMGCRCQSLELNLIKNYPGKRLILILNKIDLVPIDVVMRWKEVLSREYPTIMFKSNLQQQQSNLSGNSVFKKQYEENPKIVTEIVNTSMSVGAEQLLSLLKNYSRVENGETNKITVGIFGFPNVGKSSVINSLTRRKAAGVSSRPGHTVAIQEIDIDSKVTLIDSPGVVMSSEDEIVLLLRNTIKADQVVDLNKAIEEIFARIQKEELLRTYKVADFSKPTEFLVNLALKMGKIKKGGVPNLEEAAKIVIRDWNEGKLKYYVPPPVLTRDLQNVVSQNE